MVTHETASFPDAPAPRRWARVRQLRDEYGLSKSWVFGALRNGTIRGRKLGGVLLIDVGSIEAAIASSPEWKPTADRRTGGSR